MQYNFLIGEYFAKLQARTWSSRALSSSFSSAVVRRTKWWGVGVVICLEWGADCLHMVQLTSLPSTNPVISCQASFYRAMLCIRGTSHGPVSVSVSVCLSQVGVLLKRLDCGLKKFRHSNSSVYRWYPQVVRRRFVLTHLRQWKRLVASWLSAHCLSRIASD